MSGTLWLHAGLLVLGLVYLLSTWRLLRRAESVGGGSYAVEARSDIDADAADPTVRCAECDAVNEAGYRYCRACVTELPGASGPVLQRSPNRTGNVF